MLGIIIAMKDEFSIETDIISKSKKIMINNQDFFEYKKENGSKIIFTYSGIGKVNSSIATFNLLSNFRIKNILNIGTCGSLSKNIEINDIIFCDRFYSYDVDLSTFGYDLGEIPKEKKFYSFKSEFSNEILDLFNYENMMLKKSYIASGDSFISYKNINKFPLLNIDNMNCVDMESWSIAFVCDRFNVNLVSLKIISDLIFKKESDVQFKKNIIHNKLKIEYIVKKIINID